MFISDQIKSSTEFRPGCLNLITAGFSGQKSGHLYIVALSFF